MFTDKVIELGLYLLAFILPFQTRLILRPGFINGYSEFATISLYATDVLLIVILLFFLFQKSYKLQATSYKLKLFLTLLILGSFLSVFFAPDKILAIFALSRLFLGIGLFFVLVKANYGKIKLIRSFLAGVFIQAGLGIWQFLTQATFSIKGLGMAIHNASVLGDSVVETAGGRWLRAYGSLDHPNMLGGLLMIGILVLLYLVITNKTENNFLIFNFKFLNKSQFLNFINFFLFYFLLLTFSFALFFSFSRAAWMGLVLGILTMLFMVIYEKNFFGQREILKSILVTGLSFFVLAQIFGNLVWTRVEASSRLEVKSTSERIETYKDFEKIIKHDWLFGTGIGNYELALGKIKPGLPAYFYEPVNNVFLLVWGETGILGIIGFIGLLFSLIYLNIKNCLKIKNLKFKIFGADASDFSELGLALITALSVSMLFDHWLWSLHFGILLFWMIMGLTLKSPSPKEG